MFWIGTMFSTNQKLSEEMIWEFCDQFTFGDIECYQDHVSSDFLERLENKMDEE
jgi:hypothetical protein